MATLSNTHPSEQQKKDENFFVGTENTLSWEKYLYARPDYTLSSFYDLLYSYHKSHNGNWDVAYDVGCGPGQVALELTSKFARVHGSDSNDYIIKVAKQTFGSRPNLDFEACHCEELVSRDASRAGTGDMLTAAECIPLMNTEAAMASFAALLKPGGTLAIWFYGGPILSSPDADAETVKKVQAQFRTVTERSYDEYRPFKGSHWEQAWIKISGWLDNVPFDPEKWCDVRRVKWNSDRQLSFMDLEDYDFDFEKEFVSQVREEERVEENIERTFWMKENVGFEWARQFVDAAIPRTRDYVTDEVKGLFEALRVEMEGRRWNVGWPVVLLLATRK